MTGEKAPPDDIVRKARFVHDELVTRGIVGAYTLTQHAIEVAEYVLDQAALSARTAMVDGG